ncbi:NAD(P)H-quinone oxidoreductase [Cellulomonas sp. DKR-3]|uniref:NAD(P)H-quinone oxidoreductase n=1 Tax=Cellulomonas fulva TaxID=2835530 RepID=A0ABS5TW08_9CELL|nr:NAD(P)H-quinone oxidoreductase [Cellulomonas fulva]MBT0993325.1 NAD(P)H-quinone oxidoreductase [Cellulomonas fulva]
MRAVVITRPGGPDVLEVHDVAEPAPGPGELLVDVVAAGVNRADVLQREGHYPPPPGVPPWPGLEVAGVVREVGPSDEPAGSPAAGSDEVWRPGDRVAALLGGGGYAERVVVPTALALRVPDSLALPEAAALPEALVTAWMVLETADARPGEAILVRGGSGGVGSVAVQLAAARGLRVLATAGGAQRVARVAELGGADVVLDHRSDDLVEQVREATSGRGADVVLDVLGAGGLEENVAVLALDGRVVVIGLQQGRRGTLDVGELLARRGSLRATTLRSRPARDKARLVAAVREHAWPLVTAGRVRPVVHATLPLDQAGRAHELLTSGEVFGKLLLEP